MMWVFFILKSNGNSRWVFFETWYCFDLGNVGQISPYFAVIRSIIDSSGSESLRNDEGVSIFHIPIGLWDGDDDKQGETGDLRWGVEHVERICSIVSDWMMVGNDDTLSVRGGDKQGQWAREVMVLINVKRSGIWWDEE